MDAVMSPQELVEKKKEHQRMRNRMKQKRHRHRHLLERQELHKQAQNMTTLLAMLRSLKEKDELAFSTRKNLLEEYKTTRQLAEAMTEWVVSMTSPISMTLSQPLTWVSTTLVADREARKLGMDWFSKHLYHNTDRMVQFADFPSESTVSDLRVTEVDNGDHNVIGRVQMIYSLPLEQAYEALKERIWSSLKGDKSSMVSEFLDQDITQAIDKDMLYRRAVLSVEEANYYVCRIFHSQDRIVFLMGNFNEDALLPKNKHWRPRMFWYVLERIGPNTTRLRVVLYNAPYIMDGKMITWKDELVMDNEAKPDLSEEDNFHHFQSLVHSACQPIILEELAGLQID